MSGFVQAVEEDGGLCTFTLTPAGGGEPVSVSTSGVANVGTTSCGTVQVPVAKLSPGVWSAQLIYESDAGIAASQSLEVQVR